MSNCLSTLFNWCRVCLWKHLKHVIYDGINWMCWLAEQDKDRLEGESFSPQCSDSLSLQIQTRIITNTIGVFMAAGMRPYSAVENTEFKEQLTDWILYEIYRWPFLKMTTWRVNAGFMRHKGKPSEEKVAVLSKAPKTLFFSGVLTLPRLNVW